MNSGSFRFTVLLLASGSITALTISRLLAEQGLEDGAGQVQKEDLQTQHGDGTAADDAAQLHSDPVFQEFRSLIESGRRPGGGSLETLTPLEPLAAVAGARNTALSDIDRRAHAAELLLRAARILNRTEQLRTDTALQAQVAQIRDVASRLMQYR